MGTQATPDESDILRNFHIMTSLYDKIIGQKGFKKADGSFEDRLTDSIGRLSIPDKEMEILIQQGANHGMRIITIAKLSDGIPFATCTIPSDTKAEEENISITGTHETTESFYEYVLELLPEKSVTQEEVNELIADRAGKASAALAIPGQEKT